MLMSQFSLIKANRFPVLFALTTCTVLAILTTIPLDASAQGDGKINGPTLEQQLKELGERKQQDTERLEKARDEYRQVVRLRQWIYDNMVDQHHVVPESFDDVMKTLVMQRMEVEIDLAGKQARAKAVEETITMTKQQASQKVKQDRSVALHTELLQGAKAEYAQIRELHKKNLSSTQDVLRARAQVSEAELGLEMRKQQIAEKTNSASARLLVGQLSEIKIDLAELQARETILESKMAALRPVVTTILRLKTEIAVDIKASHERVRSLRNALVGYEAKLKYIELAIQRNKAIEKHRQEEAKPLER